jgi:hypothetical protein
MSYGRDRDAYTRGAGAIAAADHGNARRAAARRAKIVRSEALDVHRSGLTYGPFGGLGSKLGIAAPVLRAPTGIDVPPQGDRGTPPPITQPPGGTGGGRGGGTGRPILPGRVGRFGRAISDGVSMVGEPGTSVSPWDGTVGGGTVGGSRGGGQLPPITPGGGGSRTGTDLTVVTTPTPGGFRPPKPLRPSGGAGAGGGAGGAGVVTGGRGSMVVSQVPPPSIIIDTFPEAIPEPVVTRPSSTKKYLLIAALVGGAYLVLRDRKAKP